MKRWCMLLMLAAAALSGCSRVQEPWISGPDQLRDERMRSEAALQELRHRLIRVQTDR